jgi:hypothetical protein
MNRFDKPTTHFLDRRVTGVRNKNGEFVMIFDDDIELVITPQANPFTTSQLSLSVVKISDGYGEVETLDEEFCEGDY